MSGGVLICPEGSERIPRVLEGSGGIRRGLEGSRGVWRSPEGSKGVWRGPEGFIGVQSLDGSAYFSLFLEGSWTPLKGMCIYN